MSATPQFQLTDAGLAAASVATPTGPYIGIVGFQIGDGYGYLPQSNDPGINGTLLYQGVPISYSYIGDNTIDIQCRIPPDAGPFKFGEVALMLAGGVMFAKAVFDSPQQKFSSLGTNVASTYTFHCLLKLAQSVTTLKITTDSGVAPPVQQVFKWSDVYPPNQSANPDTQVIIVKELSPGLNDSSLLTQSSSGQWTLGTNYPFYSTAIVANATLNYVEVLGSTLPASTLTGTSRLYVIRFSDGYFRSVASVVQSGANLRFNLNPDPLINLPAVGATLQIYTVAYNLLSKPYVQQGTGVGQLPNTVKIGWTGANLAVTVDATNFGFIWPISIAGTAATLARGGNPSYPMTFNYSGFGGQPTWLWGTNDGTNTQVYNPSNFSVSYASNAGHASSADYSTNASHANNADLATTATNANYANNANHANSSDTASLANNASNAAYAINAGNAAYASNANHANIADSLTGGNVFHQSGIYGIASSGTASTAMMCYAISGYNTTILVYINGQLVLQHDARDKYGQGQTSVHFVLNPGDSYGVSGNASMLARNIY